MSERLYSLMEKHQKLDEKLRLAQRSVMPDPHEVGRLKKMKLAIKDRLARFSNQPSIAG
ncbi:YdcH family protein [Altererythrobacter sp. ZODW24]|uniref:YdcH family protein n=1 Tax=Altererythrobacter sp. ZODW24 TaxID=2185142 RepID=UPI000DF80D43|nr:YdcH family protein [Altererythrobacter sp. ZODW24]